MPDSVTTTLSSLKIDHFDLIEVTNVLLFSYFIQSISIISAFQTQILLGTNNDSEKVRVFEMQHAPVRSSKDEIYDAA